MVDTHEHGPCLSPVSSEISLQQNNVGYDVILIANKHKRWVLRRKLVTAGSSSFSYGKVEERGKTIRWDAQLDSAAW